MRRPAAAAAASASASAAAAAAAAAALLDPSSTAVAELNRLAATGGIGGGANPFGANNVRVRSTREGEHESGSERYDTNAAIERTFAELNRWHDEERREVRNRALGLLPPARGAAERDAPMPGAASVGMGAGMGATSSAGLGRRRGSIDAGGAGGSGGGSKTARPATGDGRMRSNGACTDRPMTAHQAGVGHAGRGGGHQRGSTNAAAGSAPPRAPNRPQPPRPSPRTAKGAQPAAASATPKSPRRQVAS